MANSPLGTVLNLLRTRLEPASADTTDRELLQRFVAGQEEGAFGELVRRHGPMILGVCRRVLGDAHAAEDAFQATFLVLVRRARAVPWRESLGGWLHGTARRVALRAKARADRGFDAGRTQTPAAPPDPSEEAAARELRRVLDQELQGLPAKYRAPLVLCDLEGKTHEQAARELGWPRGSVAKRLNGAREQLRARLVRRGVALSAGALASVFTANEVTAAPSAALAAAALLAAEGGASTTATALAKGVIQAMWLTKIKTAAVLMLALTVAGTMAGFGAYRAWEARAAAPAPSTSAPPPTAEDKQMMPIDKAVIYHVGPVQGVQTDQLPEGAVVATDRPESVDDNVHLYLTIFAESKKGKLALPAGPNLAILAVGPVLNSPDEAAVVGLSRHGDKLDLEMAYTSAIAEGKVLKRNVPSRPLVQLPVDLAAGRYRLTVTWQARKALPAGDAWNLPPTITTCDFTVTGAARAESKAVRSDGAEFRAFVEGKIRVPVFGEVRAIDLGLRITNTSDKPLVFYNVAKLTVTTPDGKELEGSFAPALFDRAAPKAITVDPGKDMTPPFDAILQWTGDGKQLQVDINDYEGNRQSYFDVKPGKYLLTAEYTLEQSPEPNKPFWIGKAKTEPAAFEVVASPNASKSVRVEGLEFTALAPARVAAPPPGGKAEVDLGLKITNVSDKTITVWVSDVINPRLVTPAGKEPLKPDVGRNGLPKPKPPETLGPGESWTWHPEASLSWTNDRATLMLSGPDGRGVPGSWSFTTLHPGKYQLILGYSSSTTKYIDIPVWAGQAMTEPVDFEIVGP